MPTLAVGIDARQATIGGRLAARAISQLRKQTVLLQNQQKLLQAQFVKTGAAAKTTGMGMGGMITGLMALGAVVKMVKTWSAFDDAMRRVKGVVQGTAEQMALMEHTARRLGAATSFTATESAQGMLMLSRAGMSVTEVVSATGAVLDLAKVAAIGLQQSATLTADSLKQFSMKSTQAREAADTLAHAANNANTDITQLGEGLKMAGPIAAAAGMSLADTSVVLGILADNGLKASLGGTGVRAMLASLGDPSDEAAAALTRLGIDVATLGDKIQTKGGLREVMSKLGPDIMGMTDAIRIFSRRGAAAALIMGRSTKAWATFDDKMKNANGTVRKSAALIEDSLGDAFKQMGSAIEEAVHQLGDSGLAGGLKDTVHWFTEGIRVMGDWTVGMTKAGAAAATLIITLGMGGLAGIITSLIKKFIAAKAAAAGFLGLISAHPILAITTAVAGLGLALVAMSDNANFAGKEMISLNKTLKDMNVATASVMKTWTEFELFKDKRKQLQAINAQIVSIKDASTTFDQTMRDAKDKVLTPAWLKKGLIELPRISGDVERLMAAIRDDHPAAALVGLRKAGKVMKGSPQFQMPPITDTRKWEEYKLRTSTQTGGTGGRHDSRTFKRDTATRLVSGAAGFKPADVLKSLVDYAKALETFRNELMTPAGDKGTGGSKSQQLRAESEQAEIDLLAEGMQKHKNAMKIFLVSAQQVDATRKREIALMGLGTDARRMYSQGEMVVQAVMKATGLTQDQVNVKYRDQIAALGLLIVQTDTVTKKTKKMAEAKDGEIEKLAQATAATEQYANDIATAMVNPLVEALQSGDWANVGKTIIAQLQAAMITQHITKPLIAALSGAISPTPAPTTTAALGAAFIGGTQRFARGGVVDRTTGFGMSGGRTGIMGEAGPEAIMPLRRGAGGRLGVEAQGGGQVVNDNRTINISVRDDAGFRRTMRQLDRDTAKRMETGIRQ